MTTSPHTAARPINWTAAIEAALLGGIGVMLLAKALHGVLVFYIHPRFTSLIVLVGVALLVMAGVRARSTLGRAPEPTRAGTALLAIPLLLGVLVPVRPLGANALQGTTELNGTLGAVLPEDSNSEQWNLLQWATAISIRGDELEHAPADVTAFVYHDPARPFDGFFAVRYVITCCSADGSGVALPVVWKGGAALPADSWVRIRGALGSVDIGSSAEPALVATSVEQIPPPEFPYLYP